MRASALISGDILHGDYKGDNFHFKCNKSLCEDVLIVRNK